MASFRLARRWLAVVLLVLVGCSCGERRAGRSAPVVDNPAADLPAAGVSTGGIEPTGPDMTDDVAQPTVPSPGDPREAVPTHAAVRALKSGARWQWQLSGTIRDSLQVEAYDIDLFDAPQSVIERLHGQGKAVICYFSAGSREDWRADADDFDDDDHGESVDDWRGESWLDIRSDNVRAVMRGRLDLAKTRGCDAVEPDNVDGFVNRTGFPLTRSDQIAYNLFLAREAHTRGLGVGLKNSPELVVELEPAFDWALTEQCLEYRECARFRPFVDAGKAVLHTEYVDSEREAPAKLRQVCASPLRTGFSTLVKTWSLGSEYYPCEP